LVATISIAPKSGKNRSSPDFDATTDDRRRFRYITMNGASIMLGFAALGTFAIGEADWSGLAPFIEWLTRWRRRGRR
jgi:hypothetical protein